nr:IncF plasmid conjugative transfer protein TraD [Escherichia coli]
MPPDLWKECLTQPDFDNTANTLIPMGYKRGPVLAGFRTYHFCGSGVPDA